MAEETGGELLKVYYKKKLLQVILGIHNVKSSVENILHQVGYVSHFDIWSTLYTTYQNIYNVYYCCRISRFRKCDSKLLLKEFSDIMIFSA